MGRSSLILAVVAAAACGTPSSPVVVVAPATAPVIQSITVPTSRVEAGRDIEIVAAVVDADTPLSQLTYTWATSAGTIAGTGAAAVWRMEAGITSGVDVTVTLTVTDTYDAVENNTVVKRQFVVAKTSSTFRVHDSDAETKELARRFLIDLFGNSSVPPDDCLVDFADICADWDQGRNDERQDIIRHRETYVVHSATMLLQRIERHDVDFFTVHNAVSYDDQEIGMPPKEPTCGDYYLTTIYVNGRWWLCQSRWNRNDQSGCPPAVDNTLMSRILDRRSGRVLK